MAVRPKSDVELSGELDEIAAAAADRLRAVTAGDVDRDAEPRRRVGEAASRAIGAGLSLAMIADAEQIGQGRARVELGPEVLRRVERAARRKREAEREYEQAVIRAGRLGLAHRDVAAAAQGRTARCVRSSPAPTQPPGSRPRQPRARPGASLGSSRRTCLGSSMLGRSKRDSMTRSRDRASREARRRWGCECDGERGAGLHPGDLAALSSYDGVPTRLIDAERWWAGDQSDSNAVVGQPRLCPGPPVIGGLAGPIAEKVTDPILAGRPEFGWRTRTSTPQGRLGHQRGAASCAVAPDTRPASATDADPDVPAVAARRRRRERTRRPDRDQAGSAPWVMSIGVVGDVPSRGTAAGCLR
jgi:hypothetical protein